MAQGSDGSDETTVPTAIAGGVVEAPSQPEGDERVRLDRYRCSFCNKGQGEVRRLIAGPNRVYICDECVQLCREIIEEEEPLCQQSPVNQPEKDNLQQALAILTDAQSAFLALQGMEELAAKNAAFLPSNFSQWRDEAVATVAQKVWEHFAQEPTSTEDSDDMESTPDDEAVDSGSKEEVTTDDESVNNDN